MDTRNGATMSPRDSTPSSSNPTASETKSSRPRTTAEILMDEDPVYTVEDLERHRQIVEAYRASLGKK